MVTIVEKWNMWNWWKVTEVWFWGYVFFTCHRSDKSESVICETAEKVDLNTQCLFFLSAESGHQRHQLLECMFIFCIYTAWAMLCGHGLHRLVIIPILPHSQFVASVLTLLTVDNNQPTAKSHHIGIKWNSYFQSTQRFQSSFVCLVVWSPPASE